MFQPDYVSSVSLTERLRTGLGRRTIAAAVTLLVEALFVLAIWSFSQSNELPKPAGELVATFDAADEPKHQDEKKQDEPTPRKPAESAPQPAPQPAAPPIPQPAPTIPPFIPISPRQMQQADISPPAKVSPAKPGAPVYGPPNTGNSMDSKRVGTAPDGQPMYAASWYRKPLPGELDGYLSTANHPGWGMIACKTAPDYRVENCVMVDEYPDHSNYGRAVLAAAWQFKVRPPRIGGREVIGAWVRIKIYDQTGSSNAE